MFRSFRWRIVTWFICLSMLIYVFFTACGVLFLRASLTTQLDNELHLTASELSHAIEMRGGDPHFRDWLRIVHAETSVGRAAIQLFNRRGDLIEHHGADGITRLSRDMSESSFKGRDMRIQVANLVSDGELVGYLQVQLPTNYRDSAVRQVLITFAMVMPAVLLGLGISSWIVSGKAVAPIQDSLKMLHQFMADAGHELNTPLSIVEARAESLERKLTRLEMPLEDIRIILSSSQRMGRIVSDLMLLAEIESPLRPAARVEVEVAYTVRKLASEFEGRFIEKGIALNCHEIQPVKVQMFADSLEKVVGNLLENALRYTEAGQAVDVSVLSGDHHVHIQVSDTGIGIPEENLPYIFQRFYRVDQSRSRNSGGVGLGLAIVKSIVELHNGSVEVKSRLGSGSQFTVILPVIG